MAFSYVKLATVTLSANSPTVNFINIPQTYHDLIVRFSARSARTGTTSGDSVNIRFNGDYSTSNYSDKAMRGNGSTAISYTNTSAGMISCGRITAAGTAADVFGNTEVIIAKYTASTYKTVHCNGVNEYNGTEAYQEMTAGIWASTAPIQSIILEAGGGSPAFVAYSTFHLYGIKAEI